MNIKNQLLKVVANVAMKNVDISETTLSKFAFFEPKAPASLNKNAK